MSWIAITIDTLYEAKVAALIDACDSAALADGQVNRSAGIIQGVVDEIRRKVGSCPNNRVDADLTTVPKGCRDMAVDMIIARLKIAIEQELAADERTQLERHDRNLNRIAECKDVVDQPDTPVTPDVERGPGVTLVRPASDYAHPYGGFGAT